MQNSITFLDAPPRQAPEFVRGSVMSPPGRIRLSDLFTGKRWARIYQYRELFAGVMMTALGFGLLAATGRGSAIAPQYTARVPYCEAIQGGLFVQPVNTLSNLVYCFSGLVILWRIGRDRQGDPRLAEAAIVSHLFGWIAVLQGFTSAAFHGTLTRWGGISDNVAMNLLVSLVLVYNVVRMLGGAMQTFAMLYTALNGLTTAYLIHDDSGSLKLFTALVLGAILSECMVLAPRWFPGICHRIRRIRRACLGYALASFAVGWGIWRLSDTSGPLCTPSGWLQGHAVWHLFTSLTILLLFVYFRSESAPLDAARAPDAQESKLGLSRARLV